MTSRLRAIGLASGVALALAVGNEALPRGVDAVGGLHAFGGAEIRSSFIIKRLDLGRGSRSVQTSSVQRHPFDVPDRAFQPEA